MHDKDVLQQYLKTFDVLDRESDALFESIRPALQTIRENRTAVYLEMLEVLPASVLYELDRLYQRPLWGCNVNSYIFVYQGRAARARACLHRARRSSLHGEARQLLGSLAARPRHDVRRMREESSQRDYGDR